MNIKVLIYSVLFLFSINTSCVNSSEVSIVENDTVDSQHDEKSEDTVSITQSIVKTSTKIAICVAAALYAHYMYYIYSNKWLLKRRIEKLAPHRKDHMVAMDERRPDYTEPEKCPICLESGHTLFHSASCRGQYPHAYCYFCLDKLYGRSLVSEVNCPTCGLEYPLGLRGRYANLDSEVTPWSTYVKETITNEWMFLKSHPGYIFGILVSGYWLWKGSQKDEHDSKYFYYRENGFLLF